MMAYRDAMFQLVLAEYPFQRIREAFIEHVSRKPELPTPSDIVNIIEPPKPKPDWAAYVAIKKRAHEGDYIYPDERQFISQCEQYAVSRMAEDVDDYRSAQREIEAYKQRYELAYCGGET